MLDVMHYEKNVCENMLKTIFGDKDTMATRKDMQEANMQPKLWLQQIPNGNYIKLMAPHVTTKQEKKAFLQTIKNLKTPSCYAITLQSRLLKRWEVKGLKVP
jgi:hypothetical protein